MKKAAGKFLSAFGFTQLVMIVAISFALYLAYEPWRWGRVKDELHRRFPLVTDVIEPVKLDQWLRDVKADPAKQGPQILDARTLPEFTVSHLPGARHVLLGMDLAEMGLFTTPENRDAELKRPIVCYCTVGYESSELIERLKRLGFTRVQMLEGGVFRWANESRSLVGASGASVKVVHPGNTPHKGLLHRAARAKVQ